METIVNQLTKILGDKKELKSKVRVGIFTLLKELVQSTPNSLAQNMSSLVPGIKSALEVC